MNTTTCITAAVTALTLTSAATAGIDINGGASWNGWNHVGDSLTAGLWLAGSTSRTYDIYSASFVLTAGQSVGGSRLANGTPGDGSGYTGDNAASLFSGSWQAGDRILGMGISYNGSTRGTTWFFKVDAGGNNRFAASSVGASDGSESFNAADTASYVVNTNPLLERGRVQQYSVWSGFSADGAPSSGNYAAPYGTTATLASPLRSFTILDAGSSTASTSIQFFLNIDAVLRSNGGMTFGDASFDPSTRFGFWEGDQRIPGSTPFTQQVFAIPAPGALALLGLTGLAATRRRR